MIQTKYQIGEFFYTVNKGADCWIVTRYKENGEWVESLLQGIPLTFQGIPLTFTELEIVHLAIAKGSWTT